MISMDLKEIRHIVGGRFLRSDDRKEIKSFSIDSRTINPADIFIAIKGKNHDGHDHIHEAIEKGASGIIAERPCSEDLMDKVGNYMLVEDSLKAMWAIASALRAKKNIPFICITGTNGKTTVKEILSHILSAKYNVLKTQGSFNNLIGISLTSFFLSPEHDIAVFETGTNHPGEIAELSAMIRPEAAVITGIGDGHMEFFGTREGVFREKISLLDNLSPGGTAFLNNDDLFLSCYVKRGVKIKYFGRLSGSDYEIRDIIAEDEGYTFSLNGEKYRIPFDGKHNIYNATAAIAVARYFGVEPEAINERLKTATLPKMRLEKVKINGIVFINDSYNANPVSFESAIETLSDIKTKGKKWVIAGNMLELGGQSADFHRKLGMRIAARKFDMLVTLGDIAADIAQGALSAGMDEKKVYMKNGHAEIYEHIKRTAEPGDVILLKGSRGAKMEEILKCFTTSCTH
ncbi:MAG TPA: UDP-N-acetylmuramoyl-tripeptide--D-alanyl-D-alanine ligase [Candidatus Omnitrophota bacterium]|nr:UDP-N-acetylmuramoyl-tripeptide--D-alanyl-D-alanine ligase [Candidatus Omnitrophota bacterium]